jgi:hypothetical protein
MPTVEELEDDLAIARSQIPGTMEAALRHYQDFLRELTDKAEDGDEDAVAEIKLEVEKLRELAEWAETWTVP